MHNESSVDDHRLFIVSAGNVREFDGADAHLDRSDTEPVEDPAQAWNVLTVGASTELIDVAASGSDFAGWTPTAASGELSPFSRTSVAFARQWPIKPEIVMEGGNTARSPGGEIDWPDSLQLLTTHHEPARRMLTTCNATSAATAQASRLAGVIAAEYPSLWPETVRALLVHSAEWTPAIACTVHGRWYRPTRPRVARSLLRIRGAQRGTRSSQRSRRAHARAPGRDPSVRRRPPA